MRYRITSEFGVWEPIRVGAHTGIDMAMPIKTDLRSVIDGIITKVIKNDRTGNGVTIKGTDGREYTYAHMDSVSVKVGDSVKDGDFIGASGNSGNSTGPHLHFEVMANGEYVDPSPYAGKLDKISGDINGNFFTGPSNVREEVEACFEPSNAAWYDLDSKMNAYINYQGCLMKEEAKEQIYAFLKALAETTVELSSAVALLGGGVLILLYVGGMTRAKKYFGVLMIINILIKAVLGGAIK